MGGGGNSPFHREGSAFFSNQRPDQNNTGKYFDKTQDLFSKQIILKGKEKSFISLIKNRPIIFIKFVVLAEKKTKL